MTVKINLTIRMKNHAADPEIGFLAKSISKSNSCATAMPTAWKLKHKIGSQKCNNQNEKTENHPTKKNF